VGAVGGPKTLGHQKGDVLPHHLAAVIAEEPLKLSIDFNHAAIRTDSHQRVRGGLEELFEQTLLRL
jgi:hypothetical protein